MIKLSELFYSFFHTGQTYKLIIYILSILFSLVLVAITGLNTSSKWWVSIFGAALFVFIDLIGQYALSMGKHYILIKSKKQIIYFIAFGIYIVVFNIPSAVAFFTSEMKNKDVVVQMSNDKTAELKNQLDQLSMQISNLNVFIAIETKTGYGNKSIELNSNLNVMLKERKELFNKLYETSDTEPEHVDTYFQGLSSVFKFLSESDIKFIMFYVAMALLVFAMVVTCPAFPAELVDKNLRKNNLKLFVSNLIRPSGSLNGLGNISQSTGIPMSECRQYQKKLIDLKLIETGKGGAKTSLTMDEIMDGLK